MEGSQGEVLVGERLPGNTRSWSIYDSLKIHEYFGMEAEGVSRDSTYSVVVNDLGNDSDVTSLGASFEEDDCKRRCIQCSGYVRRPG